MIPHARTATPRSLGVAVIYSTLDAQRQAVGPPRKPCRPTAARVATDIAAVHMPSVATPMNDEPTTAMAALQNQPLQRPSAGENWTRNLGHCIVGWLLRLAACRDLESGARSAAPGSYFTLPTSASGPDQPSATSLPTPLVPGLR